MVYDGIRRMEAAFARGSPTVWDCVATRSLTNAGG